MGIVEVLDASTVSGRTFVSVSASTAFFTFGFSTTASTTTSTRSKPLYSGWLNGANHSGQLQTVDFAAFQLFIQQLRRFGHAKGQRFVADVFITTGTPFQADW